MGPAHLASTFCAGEHVGLKEIDNGIRDVSSALLKPGRLLEREMRIADANGRLKRDNR